MGRLAGRILFFVVLVGCILIGLYAAELNAESTLAGWGAGIGVVLVLGAIVAFIGAAEKKALIGSSFLAVGAVLLFLCIARPLLMTAPYKEHIGEYMAIASANSDPFGGNTAAPIKGKIVPVDMVKKKIDPLLVSLPGELRPGSPAEVGTIAALWWYEHQIGTYAGKGGAYKWECKVVLWDKAAKAPLAEADFEGSDPPGTSNNGAAQWGSKPYKEIGEYLRNLHR